jgi:YD repeat-containing protein
VDSEKTYRRHSSINQNIESYTYDKTGNRKTDTTNTIGTNYATNLLDQYTSQTGGVNKNYTYDANGNLKSDGTKSFIYDYQNHLVQVTQSGITLAQYQYDVLGRRVQKTTPTESIIYVYAGDNIVQEIKNI